MRGSGSLGLGIFEVWSQGFRATTICDHQQSAGLLASASCLGKGFMGAFCNSDSQYKSCTTLETIVKVAW